MKVDTRFKALLTEKRFQTNENQTIDKFGRKIYEKTRRKQLRDEMHEFYDANDESPDLLPQDKDGKTVNETESRFEYLQKLSRGEIASDVDSCSQVVSESDDDSDEDLDEVLDSSGPSLISGFYEDQHNAKVETEEEEDALKTDRLAVCGCDWDHLSAQDLLYAVSLH